MLAALQAKGFNPEKCSAGATELTKAQVKRWLEQGYVLLDGLLPRELTQAARAEAVRRLRGQVRTDSRADTLEDCTFPTGNAALDGITLHPHVLRAVAQCLGTEDILLSQSDAWAKKGVPEEQWRARQPHENHEQRLHVTFPNNCLTAPAPWDAPEVVALIIYLDESGAVGGGEETRLDPISPTALHTSATLRRQAPRSCPGAAPMTRRTARPTATASGHARPASAPQSG